MKKDFWKNKSLEKFSEEEWESICCNCGKCCLIKLQDDETEEIYYTNIVCKYFNHENCTCKEYKNRCTLVPECLKLNILNIDKISWMPDDCAYKTLFITGELPEWHPLVTGKPIEDIHSVKGRVICQTKVNEEDWEDYIIEDEGL